MDSFVFFVNLFVIENECFGLLCIWRELVVIIMGWWIGIFGCLNEEEYSNKRIFVVKIDIDFMFRWWIDRFFFYNKIEYLMKIKKIFFFM